jgi:hypothetical protein
MDASTQTFPDGTDRALNFANVRVGGDRVKVNGVKGSVEAVKVMVSVDIDDVETSTGVHLDDGGDFTQDGGVLTVGD